MNWFEIEQIKPTGVEVVKLDPKTRKGELTFKVTNVSGNALRAGAIVFPQEDEQKAWTSIKGEEIQEMGEDAEKTFKVGIAAPSEAKPRTYSITFVVCNEANPEEETAELKAEFKIDTPAEQAVSRVRQYRWHFLAAGLVVGIVGLMLVVLFDYLGKARFSADPTSGSAYLMVRFTDKSRGKPHSWEWDFGDGYTSDEQNPNHFYGLDPNDSYPKEYDVSLTINGDEDTKTTKKEYITVTAPELREDFEICKAAASGIREATTVVDKEVKFENLSTGDPNKFRWDFGDKGSSQEKDPNHIYKDEDTYEVKLDVFDGKVTATGTVRILKNFTGKPDFLWDYAGPNAVQFTGQSSEEPQSWEWDFGDGSTSRERNPIHTYKYPGKYNVTLTVRGEVGNADDPSEQKEVEVNYWGRAKPGSEKLIASFSCNRLKGKAPLEVHFVDQSQGSRNSVEWKFGDGSTSKKQHPTHTYTGPNTYEVTLTVNRGNEKDEISVLQCIVVTENAAPPKAEFTVRKELFENRTELVPPEYARFTFAKEKDEEPNSGKEIEPVSSIRIERGQTVKFIDLSKGNVESWSWDFGDGTPVSEERDPNHTFNRVGNFTVSLTVTGPEGIDPNEMLKSKFVQVIRKTKVETIELNEIPNMVVYPQRLLKGRDFHGPGAEFTVSAILKEKDRDVYAYLSMYIRKLPVPETEKGTGSKDDGLNLVDPNMIVAKGVVEKRIFTAPRGWTVNRIITKPTLLFWADTDKADKADYDEKEMSWCRFRVMGDTWGDDIGRDDKTQSHMIVDIVEPIKIELIEE